MNDGILQGLVDREAIRDLKHYHYCHCVDRGIAGDESALRETVARFTPDVVADFTGFPLAEGVAAVTAFYLDTVPATLSYAQHRVCNDVIVVDGEHARGLWYFDCPVVFRPGNPLGLQGAGLIAGRYEEEYRRVDGIWKWQRITALIDTLAECDGAWSGARLLRHNR
jgi:hypothetical protein